MPRQRIGGARIRNGSGLRYRDDDCCCDEETECDGCPGEPLPTQLTAVITESDCFELNGTYLLERRSTGDYSGTCSWGICINDVEWICGATELIDFIRSVDIRVTAASLVPSTQLTMQVIGLTNIDSVQCDPAIRYGSSWAKFYSFTETSVITTCEDFITRTETLPVAGSGSEWAGADIVMQLYF